MAQITFAQLKTRVGLYLGWKRAADFPTGWDFAMLADEFGDFLCSYPAGGWNFLSSRIKKLTIVGGQDFIVLPSDFRSVHDIVPVGVSRPCFIQGTLVDVARARSSGVSATGAGTYVWCVNTHPETVGKPYPTPILELGPKPATTQVEAMQLVYYAGWEPFGESPPDTALLSLPPWMQALYVRGLTLYVQGAERTMGGDLEAVMEQLVGSALWVAAERTDGMIQPMGGGIDPSNTMHGQLSGTSYPEQLSDRPLEIAP